MWMLLLKNHWKKIAVLMAMLICFAGGAYVDRKFTKPQIQVQEKIVEKEKIVTVEVEKKQTKTKKKTVIVTVPDGTKTETTTEETETKEETVTNTTKNSEKTAKKEDKSRSKYRLGTFAARLIPELIEDPLAKPDIGVMAGYRIWGPVWTETSYIFSTKQVSLGLSVEF